MSTPLWERIETEAGDKYRCTVHDQTFPTSHVCTGCTKAAVGGSSSEPDAPFLAGHAAPRGVRPAEELPTALDYERMLLRVRCAITRARKATSKLAIEDQQVESEGGRVGWRESWRAQHSQMTIRLKALAEERKVVNDLIACAVRRETPDLVKRAEQAATAIDKPRRSRLTHAEDPEAAN